jgi:16S rRNA (uracil1498-N3)-methyltransferase
MRTSDPRGAPRFFCPGDLSQGATRDLPDQAAHHAARVLRMSVGDPVILFNGEGIEATALIHAITKSKVSVRIGARQVRDVEAAVSVVLLQGLSARERMDITVQKAVELGVAEIYPVATRRSVMRLAEERAERRVEHWQHLVVSACEQCGRNRVPPVHAITSLPDWLGAHAATPTQSRLILSTEGTTRLRDLPPAQHVLLAAGPEGGFAPEEMEMTIACGFIPVRLGPRVLRTETAALAALAAIHALWGDF